MIGCLDRAMRAFGGAPTYWLTDNERTVTIDHVAGIAVRHPLIVAGRSPLRRHDRDLRPGRPRVQGRRRRRRCGSPRPIWCRPTPTCSTTTQSWAELVDGVRRRSWSRSTAGRIGSPGGRRWRCSPRNRPGCTACPTRRSRRRSGRPARCRGRRRSASVGSPTRSRTRLVDAEVWVRVDGDEIVATHVAAGGRGRGRPPPAVDAGQPGIDDAHYPPRPAGPLDRQPRATNAAEAEFLALGDGARMWLVEAAAAGTSTGEGEDGRSRQLGPAARRRAGRLGARPRRHLRPLRRRRRGIDPRRPPGRPTTHAPTRTTRCSPAPAPGTASEVAS